MEIKTVFERYEKKYLLSTGQAIALMDCLKPAMQQDEYGKHTICSVYFDSPDFICAHEQLEKPVFREKLRLRSYGVPTESSPVFFELKKKLDGVTHKRRTSLTLAEARAYLAEDIRPEGADQVFDEVDWFFHRRHLEPKTIICYDRIALYGRQDPNLRITFDADVRWRSHCLDLAKGDWGSRLTAPNEILMEIKVAGAMPLWLVALLSEQKVFPRSFSKYANVYEGLPVEEALYAG